MDLSLRQRHIEGMLFSGFCQTTGREVLLGPDNFSDLLDGEAGFELHYICHCGRAGVIFPKREVRGRCGTERPAARATA